MTTFYSIIFWDYICQQMIAENQFLQNQTTMLAKFGEFNNYLTQEFCYKNKFTTNISYLTYVTSKWYTHTFRYILFIASCISYGKSILMFFGCTQYLEELKIHPILSFKLVKWVSTSVRRAENDVQAGISEALVHWHDSVQGS